MVSRDLKPENVLLESKKPGAALKIIDFGTSQNFDSKTKMKTRTGTVIFSLLLVVNFQININLAILRCS